MLLESILEERMKSFYGLIPPDKTINPKKDNPESESSTEAVASSTNTAQPNQRVNSILLNDLDFEFLYNQLTKLVFYLQKPLDFMEDLKESKIYDNFFSNRTIKFSNQNWSSFYEKIIPKEALLSPKENRLFHWNYDFHGRKLEILEEKKEKRMFKIAESLLQLDELLYELTNRDLGLIKKLPKEITKNYPERNSEQSVFSLLMEEVKSSGGLEPQLNDTLKMVWDYKNIGLWFNELKDHAKILDKYWEVLEKLIELINRELYFTDLIFRFNISLNPRSNNNFKIHNLFTDLFRFFLGFYQVERAENVIQLKPQLEEILALDLLQIDDLHFYSPPITLPNKVDLRNFNNWKESILQYINSPQKEALPSTVSLSLVQKRWNEWYKHIKASLENSTEDLLPLERIEFLFNKVKNLDYTLNDRLWISNFSPIGDFPDFNEPKRDIIEKFTRTDWSTLLVQSNLDSIESEASYVPFWMQIPAMLWLGLYPSLKKQKEFAEGATETDNDSNETNSNRSFFTRKNAIEDESKIEELFRIIEDRVGEAIYYTPANTILLIVEDNLEPPNFGSSIAENSGLLMIKEKDLRIFGKDRMSHPHSFFTDFGEYIIYAAEAKIPILEQLIPVDSQSTTITYFSPDSNLESLETKEGSINKQQENKTTISNELQNHIRKSIHSNRYFRAVK